MTADLIDLAVAGDEEAFRQLVAPFERELKVHCYRMLGSFADAEDALQDALLAAWQGLPGFEGRASVRTWLYRVATSRCLNARRSAQRRQGRPGGQGTPSGPGALPPGTAPPGTAPPGALPPGLPPALAAAHPPAPTRLGEVTWLEPCPDSLLEGLADAEPGPEARYEAREAISLAFVTAVQRLPPRQRAVLLLRDVLGFPASESARILGVTEESVTSALKRARATLRTSLPDPAGPPPAPGSPVEKDLVERLTRAYEAGDVDAIIALFADDAWLTMPPAPLEYQGRPPIRAFLAAIAFRDGRTYRLVPARANGQLAFAAYLRHPNGDESQANGLHVLTLTQTPATSDNPTSTGSPSGLLIQAMTRFPSHVLPAFGLPPR